MRSAYGSYRLRAVNSCDRRFLLKALDLYWHEDCLMCGCCGCRLGEVGSTLYTKANMILCKKDYFRYWLRTPNRRRVRPLDAITD